MCDTRSRVVTALARSPGETTFWLRAVKGPAYRYREITASRKTGTKTGIGPMLSGLRIASVTRTAPARNPAMPTSRCAVGVVLARRSAIQPPASVPIRPPTTITAPASSPAPPGFKSNLLCSSVGSQNVLEARTKKRSVCEMIVARSVGMRMSRANCLRLASAVLTTAGPVCSTAPRSGSLSWNARAARIKPGMAATKNAFGQPYFSAMKPPPANPIAIPTVLPAPQIAATRLRCSFGK